MFKNHIKYYIIFLLSRENFGLPTITIDKVKRNIKQNRKYTDKTMQKLFKKTLKMLCGKYHFLLQIKEHSVRRQYSLRRVFGKNRSN